MGRERYSPEEQEFYNRYLNSPIWKEKKNERIKMSNNQCEWLIEEKVRCPRTRYLCVHHNTYERLGAELASDLNVYCFFHHTLVHLLWKKCAKCKAPCLENEIVAAKWLNIVFSTMQIYLDNGPINWKRLPNKEIFLHQIPDYCNGCSDHLRKD